MNTREIEYVLISSESSSDYDESLEENNSENEDDLEENNPLNNGNVTINIIDNN